ncbi:hypothetical protein [Streptomyces lycii]|uniref:ATPase n=1 Tax=Streptomyces lycii TaxID=2654337 RepID=A0ABQ7F8Z9_9ACTN|nr:hypothetical protein GCU69_32160 [Streptomyces lycii]
MALIALAADKGSPGVTTAAVALSAVWPRRVLLAEADQAGGDLVYRSAAAHGGPLDPNTGMLSVAATARRGLVAEQLWDHAQPMAGGLDVLVGLGSSEQAAGLAGLWPTLGRAFSGLAESPHGAADVVADCGRIGADSAAVEMFQHAALVILVSRTEPEHLARVRDRAAALSARLHGPQRGAAQIGMPLIGVLLVTDSGSAAKTAGQVNDMLVASQCGARVLGTLALDPAGSDQLAGRKRGRLEKSLLIRSARKVVSDLHQQFGAAWAGPAPAPQHGMPMPQPAAPLPQQQGHAQQPGPSGYGYPQQGRAQQPGPSGYGYPQQGPQQSHDTHGTQGTYGAGAPGAGAPGAGR